MSVWGDIRRRGIGIEVKKEDLLCIEFDEKLNYTKEEKEDIRNTVQEMHISPIIFPLKESTIIGKSVYISADKKYYLALFKERFPEDIKDAWDELAKVRVLGEYKRNEKKFDEFH